MKRLFSFVVLIAMLSIFGLLLTGCSTTSTTVCEFDKDGKIVKQTKTSQSNAIDKITESTKNKTVIAWSDGWAVHMTVSTATVENPTPTFKVFGGKVAKGLISILSNQQNVQDIAKIIQATKTDLTVSQDGINSKSPPDPVQKE